MFVMDESRGAGEYTDLSVASSWSIVRETRGSLHGVACAVSVQLAVTADVPSCPHVAAVGQ